MKKEGYIYILTNPSFPQYVKIGYADNVEERVKQLNRSECIPFAFRVYAYYLVPERLTDLKLHGLIDRLNKNLRTIEEFDGKKRVREFYEMSPEDAYAILEAIADINGLSQNLVRVRPTITQLNDEKIANEASGLNVNRHHFKELTFKSSLTNHLYHGDTNDDGVLRIFDKTENREVLNNETISKQRIVKQALLDVSPNEDQSLNLYSAYHRLCNILLEEQAIDSNVTSNMINDEMIEVFINSKYADGKGLYCNGEIIILEGTKVRNTPTNSFPDSAKKIFDEFVSNNTIENFTFMKRSRRLKPSAASSLILGNSSNGWDDWKTKDGKSLKNFK